MVAPTQQFLHKLLPILGVSPLLKHHVQTSDVEGEGVKTEVGKKFSYTGRVNERIDFNSVNKIQPVIDFAEQVFRVEKKHFLFPNLDHKGRLPQDKGRQA